MFWNLYMDLPRWAQNCVLALFVIWALWLVLATIGGTLLLAGILCELTDLAARSPIARCL